MAYRNDPRMITSRRPGTCDQCGKAFRRGDQIFWYPLGKRTLAGECAEAAAAEFRAMAADEAMTGGY